MNSHLLSEGDTQSLVLENRRLRELVVSLSATLLRTISREAAAQPIPGETGLGNGRGKSARRMALKAKRECADIVPPGC
jgi:hypothetical protein